MTEEILGRIDKKLDLIIRLLASKTIEGKPKTASILILGALGLDRNLSCKIMDTTPHTVSVILSRAKKEGKSKSKRTTEEEG